MIRATFTAAALFVCALSSQAQTPAPTPATPPTAARAHPTPPPRAKRAPVLPPEWSGPDMADLESRLDAVRDMQIDMDAMPPMPPMPPMDLQLDA
ncbi:MAG TPA: hypothetical protein VLJ83_01765, partial [Gemmatimonadaceae bacterium]|nr:hypothetical protein [Gemmatimonadaceae bacterium]